MHKPEIVQENKSQKFSVDLADKIKQGFFQVGCVTFIVWRHPLGV